MSISKHSTRDRLILFSDTHGFFLVLVMPLVVCVSLSTVHLAWADPDGGQGARTPPPPKKIGILSNTGPVPLKNHKARI